jgi:type I restriction enzyme M protein
VRGGRTDELRNFDIRPRRYCAPAHSCRTHVDGRFFDACRALQPCRRNNPHPEGFKSFFGYFKDDGFQKTKHMGRVDKGQWPTIRKHWLDLYVNREKEIGLSVLTAVAPDDEWCAEAYMETDYSAITQSDFEKVVKNYAMFRLLGTHGIDDEAADDDDG